MVKDTSTGNSPPREKRQTSLSNFISKLLPSHRAEQGGTARDPRATNDNESAYRDLGINPNDLTEWNLPQDAPFRPPRPEETVRSRLPIDHNRATNRGRPLTRDAVDHPSRIPKYASKSHFPWSPKSLGEHLALKDSSAARTLPSKLPPIATSEIHDALKAKEAIRRNRRSLKESGDWLGVQGADPYSGEFAVLTPTSTLSSDTTPLSAKYRLAELSERQRGAIAAYEEARLEEQVETERILLQKERAKLEKMEHAKEERRQLQQDKLPTWSQHRRRWSSVAEPGLSPIPQSLRSNKVGGSSDEAFPVVSVRNFSRPSKSAGGSALDEPKLAKVSGGSENIGSSRHNRRKDQSTETVIHQTLPNMKIQDMPMKQSGMLYPPVFSDTSESLPNEEKKEKNFLWKRHRRMSDPGKTRKRSKVLTMHSSARKTEENLVSTSVKDPPPLPRIGPEKPRDHFLGLPIPDHHLGLLPYSEQSLMTEKSSTLMEKGQSLEIPQIPSRAQNMTTLRVATNCSDPPEIVLDTKEATVISSQSRWKGNTTPPLTYRRVIPIRSSSFQAGAVPAQEPKIPIPTINQTRNHSDGSLPRNKAESQSIHHQSNVGETLTTEVLEEHIDTHLREGRGRDLGGSVSTPTIIITGYDRYHRRSSEGIQSHMESRERQKNSTVNNAKSLMTPSSRNGEPASREKQSEVTSSHLIMPQSGSQNSVLAHEIPETGTVSPVLAMGGMDSTPLAEDRNQHTPYRHPGCMLMKRTVEELREHLTIHGQQHHNTSEERNTPVDEFEADTTSRKHHDQRNTTAQVAHQCQGPGELNEAMIQEAARIAMRRSRAREVVTRSPSRSPSPRVAEMRAISVLRHSSRSPLQKNGEEEEGVGIEDIDVPFSGRSHCDVDLHQQHSENNKLLQGRESLVKHEGSEEITKSGNQRMRKSPTTAMKRDANRESTTGALVLIVSFVIVSYMVIFGIASAWWVVVKPAFDQRSDLWKRKRRRETTGEDVGVFAAAVVFCVGGALVLGSFVRGVVWIAQL